MRRELIEYAGRDDGDLTSACARGGIAPAIETKARLSVLRGAISGFGEVAAQAHLPGWLTRSEVSIVAVHDPVSARRHHAINVLKKARIYDDLDLMLDGEALDFVDIASPPGLPRGSGA